jgi:hypothetical protein
MTSSAAGHRVGRVVAAVCSAAVAESGASGIVLLEPDSAEAVLIRGWFTQWDAGLRVWRADTDAGNVVQSGDPALGLTAHPANKTALLLAGRLPRADLFPVGDLWASQVAELADGWTLPPDLRRLAESAGGVGALDRALIRLVEERNEAAAAVSDIPAAVAAELLRRYEAGRYWRQRPRVTPKLTGRTLGIDLFD